jgi:hypothetical protein
VCLFIWANRGLSFAPVIENFDRSSFKRNTDHTFHPRHLAWDWFSFSRPAIGVSQFYMLRAFVPGHDDMDRHPYQLTFEDLTNPACNFSCDDHPGQDAFLLPNILTCFGVSNGQILYYDTWVIRIIASVQRKPFIFTFSQESVLSHSVKWFKWFHFFLLSILNNTILPVSLRPE